MKINLPELYRVTFFKFKFAPAQSRQQRSIDLSIIWVTTIQNKIIIIIWDTVIASISFFLSFFLMLFVFLSLYLLLSLLFYLPFFFPSQKVKKEGRRSSADKFEEGFCKTSTLCFTKIIHYFHESSRK